MFHLTRCLWWIQTGNLESHCSYQCLCFFGDKAEWESFQGRSSFLFIIPKSWKGNTEVSIVSVYFSTFIRAKQVFTGITSKDRMCSLLRFLLFVSQTVSTFWVFYHPDCPPTERSQLPEDTAQFTCSLQQKLAFHLVLLPSLSKFSSLLLGGDSGEFCIISLSLVCFCLTAATAYHKSTSVCLAELVSFSFFFFFFLWLCSHPKWNHGYLGKETRAEMWGRPRAVTVFCGSWAQLASFLPALMNWSMEVLKKRKEKKKTPEFRKCTY